MLSGVMGEEPQTGPRIVVAFQNYAPPFDAEKATIETVRTGFPDCEALPADRARTMAARAHRI